MELFKAQNEVKSAMACQTKQNISVLPYFAQGFEGQTPAESGGDEGELNPLSKDSPAISTTSLVLFGFRHLAP